MSFCPNLLFQKHRVREPSHPDRKQSMRRSTVFFIGADDDVTVETLDGSNKYPPINATEYLWQKVQQHQM